MFQVPRDDDFADIRQWLNGGLFCDEAGIAYKFTGMGEDRRATGWPVYPDESLAVAPRNFRQSEIYLHWPLCGAVNNKNKKFALYVQRLPRRQYARTFCPQQVEVLVPRGYEVLARIGTRRNSLDANSNEVLRALFYPEYPANYEEAEQWLEDGWLSVALTRRVTLVKAEGKLLVFDGMTHVGHVMHRKLCPFTSTHHTLKVLKAFKGALQL